jgi:hypothetical protein
MSVDVLTSEEIAQHWTLIQAKDSRLGRRWVTKCLQLTPPTERVDDYPVASDSLKREVIDYINGRLKLTHVEWAKFGPAVVLPDGQYSWKVWVKGFILTGGKVHYFPR